MTPAVFSVLLALLTAEAVPTPFFAIEVVDDQTGRGVPLVELRTVNEIRLVTDSNGIAAFDEPGLMDGERVFFHVRSHGYEFPRDGFGYRGKAVEVRRGGTATLKLHRQNIAERLYRVTGAGIYRDSLLVGRATPLTHPALDGKVLGSDSVVNAVYHGEIRWFWGDTNRPGYPLGNFHVPGATSRLPAAGGLDPERGVDLQYLVGNDGFARPMAKMPGDGPTWIFGLVVVRDRGTGRERMFADYVKVRNMLEVYERGLVEWNDDAHQFEKVITFPDKLPNHPDGHTFVRAENDVEYVHYTTPYPLLRARADAESLAHPERFEAFTCLAQGSRLDSPTIDRGPDGLARYTWKTGTPALSPSAQAKLIASGVLKPGEGLLALRDAETGKPVSGHGGSVAWNPHRRRWVMIAVEGGGSSSFLGEVWYAEADTPVGPWVYARKVVTHDRYSFYNPKQHAMFDKDGGRVIFFEGTYTHTFSGNNDATPRYDYNQVMYRLDLADPLLNLPVAVYRRGAAWVLGADAAPSGPKRAPFFALERPGAGTVAVFKTGDDERTALVVGRPKGGAEPLFHAFPADAKDAPAATVPLHEFRGPGGMRRVYSTDPSWPEPGYERVEAPLCRVWPNPIRVELP